MSVNLGMGFSIGMDLGMRKSGMLGTALLVPSMSIDSGMGMRVQLDTILSIPGMGIGLNSAISRGVDMGKGMDKDSGLGMGLDRSSDMAIDSGTALVEGAWHWTLL